MIASGPRSTTSGHCGVLDQKFLPTKDLRAAVAQYPQDPGTHELIARLRAASPEFVRRWVQLRMTSTGRRLAGRLSWVGPRSAQ